MHREMHSNRLMSSVKDLTIMTKKGLAYTYFNAVMGLVAEIYFLVQQCFSFAGI